MTNERLGGLLQAIEPVLNKHSLTLVDFYMNEGHNNVQVDEFDGEIYTDWVRSSVMVTCNGLHELSGKALEAEMERIQEEVADAIRECLGENEAEVELDIDNAITLSVVFEPRVLLLQECEDRCMDGAFDTDSYVRSKLNKAFQQRFLPKMELSELRTELCHEFGRIPDLWIGLKPLLKDGTNEVKSIDITVDYSGDRDSLIDDDMRKNYNWTEMEQIVERHFKKMGYRVGSKVAADVYHFVEKLYEDVPEAKNFFELQSSFPKRGTQTHDNSYSIQKENVPDGHFKNEILVEGQQDVLEYLAERIKSGMGVKEFSLWLQSVVTDGMDEGEKSYYDAWLGSAGMGLDECTFEDYTIKDGRLAIIVNSGNSHGPCGLICMQLRAAFDLRCAALFFATDDDEEDKGVAYKLECGLTILDSEEPPCHYKKITMDIFDPAK